MIIGIDMGHSLNAGSNGVMREVEKNREVGNLLIDYLRKKGHQVINCTVDYANNQNEQLKSIVNKANSQYLDYFISLHLNAHSDVNANGSESYIWNGNYRDKDKTREFAKKLNDNLVDSCNFLDRGVKEYDFYVCRNTNAIAVLVEICFCTSEIDKSKWNAEKIAKGLFKGITGEDYKELEDENDKNKWNIGDLFKVHGYVTHYSGGDTISPLDYEYEITSIEGDIVNAKLVYTPPIQFNLKDIYK